MTIRDDVREAGQWLAENSLGFREINKDVKVGITYFVLIWSLFDFRFLGARGNLQEVLTFIEHIEPNQDVQSFMPHMEYFRDRYLDGGTGNHHLDALAWNDYRSRNELVGYLRQLDPTPREVVGALLLISYRLRCNLIHGSKWEHGLADQYENFRHATKAMMLLMDRCR